MPNPNARWLLGVRVFFEEFVQRVVDLRLKPGTAPVEMPNAFVYCLRRAHLEFDAA